MAADLLDALTRITLAGSAAILAVLLLRKPFRRLAGARLAYALWLAVPLVAAASLLPPRQIVVVDRGQVAPRGQVFLSQPADEGQVIQSHVGQDNLSPASQPPPTPLDPRPLIIVLWALGAAAGLSYVALRHRAFLRELGPIRTRGDGLAQATRSRLGPAVLGILRPRIVLPADFEARFSPAEQAVIVAHETRHMRAGHVRANALAVLAQQLNWFNPLAHVAIHVFRIDQELACDEAVVGRLPDLRRTYADAMLKTQFAEAALPLGCYWPSRSPHPLRERVAMLSRPYPNRARRAAGGAILAAVSLTGGLAAWAALPPVVTTKLAPSAPAAPVIAQPATSAAAATPQVLRVLYDHGTAAQVAEAVRAAAPGDENAPDPATAYFVRNTAGEVSIQWGKRDGTTGVLTSDAIAAYSPPGGVANLPVVDAPPAPAPADPLADLPYHVRASSGAYLSVSTVAPDDSIKTRVLLIGDEYRDGWILRAVMSTTAILEKDGVTREVPLHPGPLTVVPGGPATIPAALAARDFRQAAALGAKAADIVRSEQVRGRYADINPDTAAVIVGPEGTLLNVYPIRPLAPLPALPGDTTAKTFSMGGASPACFPTQPTGAAANGPGFVAVSNFGAPPAGSVVLCPPAVQPSALTAALTAGDFVRALNLGASPADIALVVHSRNPQAPGFKDLDAALASAKLIKMSNGGVRLQVGCEQGAPNFGPDGVPTRPTTIQASNWCFILAPIATLNPDGSYGPPPVPAAADSQPTPEIPVQWQAAPAPPAPASAGAPSASLQRPALTLASSTSMASGTPSAASVKPLPSKDIIAAYLRAIPDAGGPAVILEAPWEYTLRTGDGAEFHGVTGDIRSRTLYLCDGQAYAISIEGGNLRIQSALYLEDGRIVPGAPLVRGPDIVLPVHGGSKTVRLPHGASLTVTIKPNQAALPATMIASAGGAGK